MKSPWLQIAEGLKLQAAGYEALSKLELQTAPEADPLVDRSSCGIAGREWDRGKRSEKNPGGFSCFKNGRRWVARRSEVLKWLERERVVEDEDAELYRRSGIKLK